MEAAGQVQSILQETLKQHSIGRENPSQLAGLLIALRQHNRALCFALRDAKRAIHTEKASYDQAVLEVEAVRYERNNYLAEIEACRRTTYLYQSLLGTDEDNGGVEEALLVVLQERKQAAHIKLELAALRDSLSQSLQERKQVLDELKRHLSMMLDGAKALFSMVGQAKTAASNDTLKGVFFARARALLAEFEVRHFDATSQDDHLSEDEEEASSTRHDSGQRLDPREHVLVTLPGGIFLVFAMTPDRALISLRLHADFLSTPAAAESWYLQLPVEGSLFLTIPNEHQAFVLRWVNALGGTLPDGSFPESSFLAVIEAIQRTVALRSEALSRISEAVTSWELDPSDPNRIVLGDGAGVVLLLQGGASLDTSSVVDDTLRVCLSQMGE